MAHRKTQPKFYEPQPVPNQHVLGSIPISPHVLHILFRLAGPRTWIFASSSFVLGYVLSGGLSTMSIIIGVAIASLVTGATNIVNAYADRKEDEVNQPARAFWLDQVGEKGIRGTALLLYCLSALLSLFLSPLFTIILLLGIFNSIFYSARPFRFKAHPISALISFSCALALPFLGGLSVNGPPNLFTPMLWLVTYFMFCYGTVKNLPDYAGDKRAGVRTSATIFNKVGNAVLFTGILLFTPYILLLAFVGLGLLQPIYLANLALLPILGLVFFRMRRAKDSEQLEHAHTIGYFYAITFVLSTLVLSTLSVVAFAIAAGAYLWAFLVSKTSLHSRIEKRDWEGPNHRRKDS